MTAVNDAPRVLIVDDHAGFRSQARALLLDEGLDVVGEAVDAASCIAAVRRLRPDLVLLDIRLPGEDGFAIADRLAAEPAPPVVVLTSSRPETDHRPRLRRAPVRGFLAKQDISGPALLALLRAGARS